jgi:hypothetical protein
MSFSNLIAGPIFISAGLVGMFRPQWLVRNSANKSDWLNEDLAPLRRLVCAGTIIAGVAMAVIELIQYFKGA